MESIGLQHHFDKLTQVSCHILDLEITRDVNELISTAPTVDYHFSGHFTLICDLRNHRLLSRRYSKGSEKIKKLANELIIFTNSNNVMMVSIIVKEVS